MTNHGFGGAKLLSSRSSMATKVKIAKCISNVPEVTWAHVVHQGSYYDSRYEKAKLLSKPEVESRYDLILEMERKCNLDAIAECAHAHGHKIRIERITVKDQSWHKGEPGKHP